MTRSCELCADDTGASYYLEFEAPRSDVSTVERIGGHLCREHASAVREALLLLDDTRQSRVTP